MNEQGTNIQSLLKLYDDACRDRDEARRQLKKIGRSLSWRATAPLRQAAKALHSWGRRVRYTAKAGIALGQDTVAPIRRLSDNAFIEYIAQQQAQGRPIFVQLTSMSWDAQLFQRPQHMCAAMARIGAIAVFASRSCRGEPTGIKEIKPDIWFVTNRELLLKLQSCIFSLYSTDYDTKLGYLCNIRKTNLLLYEYIDHIDEAIFGAQHVPTLQRMKDFAFSGGADFIVGSAKSLYDEAVRAGVDRTLLVPNGVDYPHFAASSVRQKQCARQITDFKKKYPRVIGYFGALAPWLWYDVINELTSKRSDLGFVFIGPDYFTGNHQIISRSNVLLTGAIPYAKLPRYARAFDVCIIPFLPGRIAETTSPLKLFEYFALETPVVVSDAMIECTQFPGVIGAGNAVEFSDAIDKGLLLRNSAEFREKLCLLALENTWDKRAENILMATTNQNRGG